MATKKEIKEVLKEIGLTESEMDTIWEELLETNRLANQLNNCGKGWKDLNTHVIKQIPYQKQKDIELAEKRKKEEEEKLEKEKKEKA